MSADTLTVALTAAANAPVATNSILANLTQITYTNLSARTLTVTASSQTTGTYSLVITDKVLTASGNLRIAQGGYELTGTDIEFIYGSLWNVDVRPSDAGFTPATLPATVGSFTREPGAPQLEWSN